MSSRGWIRLYRNIFDNWIYQDEKFDKCHAWIDLLLLANHEDNKTMLRGKLVVCKRGTVNLSIKELAKRWNWHWRTAKRFLLSLQEDNMVSLECQRERTVVTIVNYGIYQTKDGGSAKGNAKQNANQNAKRSAKQNAKRSANKQECKEYKECKEIKKNTPPEETEEEIRAREEWWNSLEEVNYEDGNI